MNPKKFLLTYDKFELTYSTIFSKFSKNLFLEIQIVLGLIHELWYLFMHAKFQGRSINFSPLSKSPDYPLVYCGSARDLDETRYGCKIYLAMNEKNIACV